MKAGIVETDLEEVFQRDIPWDKLQNKTVLITGAYGMLASYMVFMLMYLNEKKGMHINIIAIARSLNKVIKRFGDISELDYFKVYINNIDEEIEIEETVDYIVHAASLASPQYYRVCPVEVLKPNVIGNYYLLKLAERKNIKGYLLFSTGDVYGVVKEGKKIKETDYGSMDTLDIHNCYSESKRMAETMCNSWFYQYNTPVKIARIWHTYAPTMDVESDPRVFASFVKDILNGRDIVMKSEGNAKRSFCYIADAIAGFFLILLCGENGEAYNVCNTQEFLSIKELAVQLVGLYPEKGLKVVRAVRNKADTYLENSVANYIPPDNTKLEALGWKAKYSVADGFKRCIESLKND